MDGVLAGQLGDMIAYAQKVRYPLPVRTDRKPDIPSLLETLESRDISLFAPVEYRTDVRVSLRPEHVDPALQQFIRWSNSNAETLKKTVRLFSEPWIQKGHDSRVQFKYVYDLESVIKRAEIELLARQLDTTIDMVCEAFDTSLRYSLYGDLADGDRQVRFLVLVNFLGTSRYWAQRNT